MTTTAVTDNRSILQKADLALTDLSSGGGLLLPAQAQTFMRIMTKASRLMGLVTVVPMKSPIQRIDKIRFAGRILHAGFEATELSAADRAKPEFGQVELNAKLFKGEVRLSNEVLEDSIERGELKNTIMQLMAEGAARDIEEVVIGGDLASTDNFLGQFDGVLKQATSHVVDAAVTTTNKNIFRDMMKSMPQEFRRDMSKLKFLTSSNSEIDYRDYLAERGTSLGDKSLEQAADIAWSGVDIVPIPLMPENLGVSNNCTNMLLLDPKNINVGIWRNIRVETDKLVTAGVVVVVVTLRADVKYAHEPAVVKAINVKVA